MTNIELIDLLCQIASIQARIIYQQELMLSAEKEYLKQEKESLRNLTSRIGGLHEETN